MRFKTTQNYFLKPYSLLRSQGKTKIFLFYLTSTQCLHTSQKSGIFEEIYSAQLKQKNNSDSQIAVYYHPCNQNTNDNFETNRKKLEKSHLL